MSLRFSSALTLFLALAGCDGGDPSGPSGPAELEASFQGLGPTSGQAAAVSAGGDVVAGVRPGPNGPRAVRWTASGGTVDLGILPNGGSQIALSEATGLSADGAVVVGWSGPTGRESYRAFRWTSAGGMVSLGTLPTPDGQPTASKATGLSADGAVVVGASSAESGGAFRWTAAGGMVNLGGFPTPGGPGYSAALAVSDDGAVVVGWGLLGDGRQEGDERHAFRWTAGGGMTRLGGFPEGLASEATAVSADGAVVVGQAGRGNSRAAFRWTAREGAVWLDAEPGLGIQSYASDVSADGAVVVGMRFPAEGPSDTPTPGEAFVWTAEGGARSVAAVLTAAGLDLAGWRLVTATAISSDGRVIVGTGMSPQGEVEAYRAVLP